MFQVSSNHSTYFEVLNEAATILEKEYSSSFVAEWLMRERLGWDKTELVKHYSERMSINEIEQFEKDMNLFLFGQPMQQVVGHEWFYGRKFKVNKHTLIPRPETEEWFDRVQAVLPQKKLKVLDIGTGTGVLALSHKLERPGDEVVATDISGEALEIAQINAKRLEADITFKKGDLTEPVINDFFDVVLCNPPYISKSEIDLMDESVIRYEPSTALFALDDGLKVYKDLAKSIGKILTDDAFIFLEIGYAQGEAVKTIFQENFPNAKIEIWQDYNQLDRVVAIELLGN